MIMSGEERSCPEMLPVMDELGNRPGDAQAIVGARTASNFIQKNQAAMAGRIEDVCGLQHFHHKGALTGSKIVGGPHPGKDSVHEPDMRIAGRHKTADL